MDLGLLNNHHLILIQLILFLVENLCLSSKIFLHASTVCRPLRNEPLWLYQWILTTKKELDYNIRLDQHVFMLFFERQIQDWLSNMNKLKLSQIRCNSIYASRNYLILFYEPTYYLKSRKRYHNQFSTSQKFLFSKWKAMCKLSYNCSIYFQVVSQVNVALRVQQSSSMHPP